MVWMEKVGVSRLQNGIFFSALEFSGSRTNAKLLFQNTNEAKKNPISSALRQRYIVFSFYTSQTNFAQVKSYPARHNTTSTTTSTVLSMKWTMIFAGWRGSKILYIYIRKYHNPAKTHNKTLGTLDVYI